MGIQNLVLSVEQMKHLGKLGLKIKDTAFVWNINRYTKNVKLSSTYINNQCSVRTLTLQEILELLPSVIIKNDIEYHLDIDYAEGVVRYSHRNALALYIYMLQEIKSDNSLKAAYEMLCWILENEYLNTNNE